MARSLAGPAQRTTVLPPFRTLVRASVRTSVRALVSVLALTVVAFVVHGAALDGPFQYDDRHSIVDNPALGDLSRAGEFFVDPRLFSGQPERAMYRPVVLLSYALTNSVTDGSAAAHRAVNLLLHALAAGLVGRLARSLWGTGAGLAAAVVFVAHPLAVEPAVYVSARSESLAWIFGLTSILLFRAGASRWHEAASGLAFGLALLAKSTAVVVPGLLWLIVRAHGSGSRRRPSSLWSHGLVAAAYLAATASLIGRSVGAGRIRGHAEQVWVVVESFVYQARLLVVPHPLSVEHPLPASTAPGWTDVAALALLLSGAWLLVRTGRRRRAWIGAALLPLVPPALVPLHAVVSEHRLYGSLAVACAGGVGWAAARLWRRRRRGAASRPGVLLLALLTVALAGISRDRAADWASEIGLWEEALRVAPANGRAHFFLGDARRRAGDVSGALAALARADSLLGGDAQVAVQRAGLLLSLDRPEAARALLEPWEGPEAPAGVAYNLGLALKAVAPARAEALFERALARRPAWREAAMELALLQDEGGAPARAAATLGRLLRGTEDSWAEGWLNLGYFQVRSGDLAGARRSWTRALELDAGLTPARQNLRRLEQLQAP